MNTRWIWLGLALLLACQPVWAQSALEPPDLSRYVRWGPLRVRPRLELRNIGYDDNIFASNENTVGDYTATLAPAVDGLILFGDRAFLKFKEAIEYTTYLDNSDQNFTNQRGSARLTFPRRGKGFFIEGRLNRLKERPADALDIRADHDEDGLGFGLILAPGWRMEMELGYSRLDQTYFDPDADPSAPFTIGDRLDRSEQRNTFEVGYRLLGRTRVTLNALWETIDFRSPTESGRDSTEWRLMPGIDFGEGGRLSGAARIGWGKIDADDDALPDFSEVVGNGEIVYRPNPDLSFRLDGEREPGFTTVGDSTYYLNTRISLRIVYYMNRIIGFESGTATGELTFPGSTGEERVDQNDSYHVGLRLRVAENSTGRRIEYQLQLRRDRRDSTIDTEDRSRTTFGINVVVGY